LERPADSGDELENFANHVAYEHIYVAYVLFILWQCFSTAGPRPGTWPGHQLYRTTRGSPRICYFIFL